MRTSKIKYIFGSLILLFALQSESLANVCNSYKKVLLSEVVSYCLVAEGVITPKEAFNLDEYHLLSEKEKQEARTGNRTTFADMKSFISANGYCKNILSAWKKESYLQWCPETKGVLK